MGELGGKDEPTRGGYLSTDRRMQLLWNIHRWCDCQTAAQVRALIVMLRANGHGEAADLVAEAHLQSSLPPDQHARRSPGGTA